MNGFWSSFVFSPKHVAGQMFDKVDANEIRAGCAAPGTEPAGFFSMGEAALENPGEHQADVSSGQ